MDKHPQHLDAYDLLNIIKRDCDSAGVKYLFPETEKIDYPGCDNMKVSGYFMDVPEPTLACAIGKSTEKWFEVLVHESCHMDQWSENTDLWENQYINEVDCGTQVDEWLAGKEFHEDEYMYYMRTMQALEIDCEKRSVEKILTLGLGIDSKSYTKRANSYLFFYTVMLHTRKWCDVAPYDVPEIVELMPDCFLSVEEYNQVSDEILSIYKDKCYNK